jgi:hypothetical protein
LLTRKGSAATKPRRNAAVDADGAFGIIMVMGIRRD